HPTRLRSAARDRGAGARHRADNLHETARTGQPLAKATARPTAFSHAGAITSVANSASEIRSSRDAIYESAEVGLPISDTPNEETGIAVSPANNCAYWRS